jgi:hypothetical protein
MTVRDLIGPAVVAAAVSGIIAIVGFILSSRTARQIHSEKLQFDEKLAERKFKFDVDLAERQFRYDRELHEHKRRVEFGEELLAGFYKFRDVIAEVRSPLASGDEGATRPRGENEDSDIARNRDSFFVPHERLNTNRDFLSEFFSKRYRARAVFRDDLQNAFQLAHEVIVAIRVSANWLIRTAGSEERDYSFRAKREADIWDGLGDDQDKLSPKVAEALRLAERSLGPILESTRSQEVQNND